MARKSATSCRTYAMIPSDSLGSVVGTHASLTKTAKFPNPQRIPVFQQKTPYIWTIRYHSCSNHFKLAVGSTPHLSELRTPTPSHQGWKRYTGDHIFFNFACAFCFGLVEGFLKERFEKWKAGGEVAISLKQVQTSFDHPKH